MSVPLPVIVLLPNTTLLRYPIRSPCDASYPPPMGEAVGRSPRRSDRGGANEGPAARFLLELPFLPPRPGIYISPAFRFGIPCGATDTGEAVPDGICRRYKDIQDHRLPNRMVPQLPLQRGAYTPPTEPKFDHSGAKIFLRREDPVATQIVLGV